MINIPIYDNPRDSLNTGDSFFRPLSDAAEKDITRGVQGLARGVEDLGEAMFRVQQRTEKFQAEKQILDFTQSTERGIDTARQRISETGTGFHDANMVRVRAEAERILGEVPASQRASTELRLQKYLGDKSDELARTEVAQGQSFIKTVTARKVEQLETNIKTGTWDRDRGVQEAEAFLSGIGLPQDQHGRLREALVRSVESSVLERLRTQNPAEFHRQTQIYTGNSPSPKAGPIQSLIIEHAKAMGADPLMILAYGKVESDFNPGQGGTGTIAGLFQLTKAERTRVGKLLGLADGESMKFDPALQTAAMVILHKEAESRLQANNIPVNPTTLWGHHLLGPGGVLAFMKSDPNADAYSVYAQVAGERIAQKAFATNGDILRPGMTVGQVMNKISGRVERAYADVQQYIHKDPAVGDTSKPMMIMGTQFEFMKPADLAGEAYKAQGELIKRSAAQIQARQAATVTDGTGEFNPYDPVHKKAMDDAAATDQAQQKILAGDKDAVARYTAMGGRGYLPKEASYAALSLINSGNREKQIMGFEMAASVVRANPTDGLRLSHFGGAMSPDGQSNAAKIRDYVNLTVHGGIDAGEAARRVSLTHSADWKIKETDIKAKVERVTRARNWSEISDKMQLKTGGFLGFGQTDQGPESPEMKRLMEEKYQSYFRFHYMERGDETIAKANAIADLQKSHNYTRIVGATPRMMPYPPERNYPPIKPLPEGKGVGDLTDAQLKEHYGYITDQALATAKDIARRRGDKAADKIKDIVLVPNGGTKQDVDQGIAPRYMLLYKDSNGARQLAVPEFRANPDIVRAGGPQTETEPRATRPAAPVRSPEVQNAKDRFRAQRKE